MLQTVLSLKPIDGYDAWKDMVFSTLYNNTYPAWASAIKFLLKLHGFADDDDEVKEDDENEEESEEEVSSKKGNEKKKNEAAKAKNKPKIPKRTLKGGIVVEDLKIGSGPEVAKGKMCGKFKPLKIRRFHLRKSLV